MMNQKTYIQFKGAKQGPLNSGGEKKSDKWVEVLSFGMKTEVPLDPTPGRPKGPRTHTPIVITKEVDSASPNLLQAAWRSEAFELVVSTAADSLAAPDPGNSSPPGPWIRLRKAQIVDVRPVTGPPSTGQHAGGKGREVVTIDFQELEAFDLKYLRRLVRYA